MSFRLRVLSARIKRSVLKATEIGSTSTGTEYSATLSSVGSLLERLIGEGTYQLSSSDTSADGGVMQSTHRVDLLRAEIDQLKTEAEFYQEQASQSLNKAMDCYHKIHNLGLEISDLEWQEADLQAIRKWSPSAAISPKDYVVINGERHVRVS